MDDTSALATAAVAMICFVGIGLAIGAVIGGALLKGVCILINAVGGREVVPNPSFLRSMGIFLATTVLTALVNAMMLKMATGSILPVNAGQPDPRYLMVNVVAIPVNLMIMAALISALLPTTILKAFLVAIVDMVILFAGSCFIGVLIGFLGAALSHAR